VVSRAACGSSYRRWVFYARLGEDLCNAVRIHVRYDTPDLSGMTRRERNLRAEIDSPEFVIPQAGKHLWDWFAEINSVVSRVRDGHCCPLPPSEILAWVQLTGNIVYPSEYAILVAMDAEYCSEVNKEFAAVRGKQEEEQARQIEKSRGKRRR